MNTKSIWLIYLFVFNTLFAVSTAWSGIALPSFSADVVASFKTTGEVRHAKVFVADGKFRVEENDTGIVAIYDGKIAEFVNSSLVARTSFPNISDLIVSIVELGAIPQSMGTENLNGKLCDKYESGFRTQVIFWIEKVSGSPLKIESKDGAVAIEFENIKIGAQQDILFKNPSSHLYFQTFKMHN
jgi:hypothetical protein